MSGRRPKQETTCPVCGVVFLAHPCRLERTPTPSCSRACANGPRHAKLTADGVREIRRRLASGETMAQLAWEYRVASSTISAVHTGLTWGWLT